MNGEQLLLVCGALVVAGGVAWHLTHTEEIAHGAIGIDPSASVERNCGGLRNAVQTFLKDKPGIREGSTLSVLVMGTDAQNQQPALSFSGPIPIRSDKVFGANEEAFRKAQETFFGEIEHTCLAAKAGRKSPIYELVKQGIAHLRNGDLHCGPKGRCYFLVKTDLDEDVQPVLHSVIARSEKDPAVNVPPELSRSLDNSGIAINFCGLSELQKRPEAGFVSSTPEARQRIWLQLFTNPELVSFQPFCR